MSRTVLVNSSHVVVDVVIAGEDYAAPDGLMAYASDTAGIGDTYDTKSDAFSRPQAAAPALDDLKADLKRQVDVIAERLRMQVITPGSGQAMEYQEAYSEAVMVSAAVKVDQTATFDPTTYPMLAASIGVDIDPTTQTPSTDIPGEARAVLAAYKAYQSVGAAIRAARLQGKADIEAAQSVDAADAAFNSINWPKLS